jgi:hypothetical protein
MTERTVRDGLADGPHDLGGQYEIATRTTSTAPRNTDSSSRADSLATPGGQFGKLTPTENTQLDESKQSDPRTREEHDEQPAGWHLTDSP